MCKYECWTPPVQQCQTKFFESHVKIGIHTFRKSLFDRVSTIFGPEDRKPLPKGLYATMPMPSSLINIRRVSNIRIKLETVTAPMEIETKCINRSHLQVGTISCSTSLVHKDHSNCTAVIG